MGVMMPSLSTVYCWCCGCWAVVEVVFYVVFHQYLRRRADLRTIPAPYRSPYDADKRSLLERIVRRILHDRGYDQYNNNDDDEKKKKNNNKDKSSSGNSNSSRTTTARRSTAGAGVHDDDVDDQVADDDEEEAEEETRVTVLAEFLLAWFRREGVVEAAELEVLPTAGGEEGGTRSVRGPTTTKQMEEASSSARQQRRRRQVSPRTISTTKSSSKAEPPVTLSPMPPSRQPSAAYSSSSSSSSSDDDEASVGDSSSSSSTPAAAVDHHHPPHAEPLQAEVAAVGPAVTTTLEHHTPPTTPSSLKTKKIVRRVEKRDANGKLLMKGWTIPGMTTLQMRRFLAWGFFGVDEDDDVHFGPADRERLQACVDYLHDELHVYGDDENPPLYMARRMTLEDVQPWHRPLLVYILVYVLRTVVADLILRGAGFRPVTARTGLRGWVRTAAANGGTNDENSSSTPLVFFHGIAPAAILLYLPLVLLGLRAPNCLLVENPNISCTLSFDALSEDDTVRGVRELVGRYFGGGDDDDGKKRDVPVVLAGHSFGSCPITWILNDNKDNNNKDNNKKHNNMDEKKHNNEDNNNDNCHNAKLIVRDVLLLDPVTILLSESDVMINFLYAHEKDNFDKIRMVASSELFTEYYLRRHFAWYNSELWLDDHGSSGHGNSCNQTKIFVGLAANDEIVNAAKVHRHIVRHRPWLDHVDVHMWDNVGHGSVVMDAYKWPMLRQRLSQSNVMVQSSSSSAASTAADHK